ncbi:hypothetical protein [Kineococcus sp. SYSU DK003]|uniref:hypothetical protein n=1 Tax=Kineococcus sp. SYSU DK003 TaxID=3383124 RepID=UPI003D7EF4CA
MSFQTLEAVASRTRVVRVNLLPTGFDQARKDRNLRVGLGVALLAVVAAAGGGYAITLGHVSDADAQLAAAQQETVRLQEAQKPYAEVPQILAQVEAAEDVRNQVSASDVPYYAYLDRLATSAPADLTYSTVTFASAGSSIASDSGTATSGVGTLSVTGQTLAMDTVAAWMDNVVTVQGLTDATVSDATRDDKGVVTFNATATLSSDALTANQ